VLAAYAPLFANVNGTQWRPDLIYFDNHRSMGTISYWVQQMFSAHRGDRLLPLKLDEVRDSPEERATLSGSIGVGSWSTRVEYKDIRVVSGGRTVFEADVSDRDQWQTLNGTWEFGDGVLRQTSRAQDCRAWVKGKTWSQYQLHLKARKTGGAEGFLVMFHVKNTGDYVWANFGGWGNSQHAVERADGGSKVQSRRVRGSIETGRWYDIRIDIDGNDIECHLDNEVVCTANLGRMQRVVTDNLYANASLDETAGEIIVRVVNIAEESKRVSLSFSGVTGLRDEATAITLYAEDRSASQSLEEPLRYSPETTVIRGVSRAFDHEFKPCSLTILRLKPR
jgi:alpha-L-arabinofuranosidase